ncbi:MAG: ABC transporter ATP-binding protein [Leptolinea sp.]|nr:ABC transporter ATP-binding protein [Leptolinea sp.]
MNKSVVLHVEHLRTSFLIGKKKVVTAVDDISFQLLKGEILGIVGESGSGKSVTVRSLLRLLPANASVIADSIMVNNMKVDGLSTSEYRKIRGRVFSMIFQEPLTALNPTFTIGWQIREVFKFRQKKLRNSDIYKRTFDILQRVRIPDIERRIKEYPHQFSGGMRQRGLIAIALASEPEILIADEPTTALDVTVQADIMDLIEDLRRELNLSVILISHNLNLVLQRCDRVIVMYAGQIMEEAESEILLNNPSHPYTIGLLNSIPDISQPDIPLKSIPGDIKDMALNQVGCPFQYRCEMAMPVCNVQRPKLTEIEPGHFVACHLVPSKEGNGDD